MGRKGTFCSGSKQLGHKVEHSLSSSAEVKNEWSCTSAPLACFHAKDSDNITFIFKVLNISI
jgi:hypothetical protein